MEDSGWAVSDTASLWLSWGSSWSCLKEFEHVFTTTGDRLTKRSHFTYISSLGSHDSKDSLAGSTLLHTFPRSRPRTWSNYAAKSKLTKRNVTCFAAALYASTVHGTSAAKLMARRHAPKLLNPTKQSCTHPL